MALLENQVALVTGGSRGIGKSIVLALADEGANVAFTYRSASAAADEVVRAVEGKGRKAARPTGDPASIWLTGCG